MATLKDTSVIIEEQEATVKEFNAIQNRIEKIPQIVKMWANINEMMFALYGQLDVGLTQPQLNALNSAGLKLGLDWKPKKEEA